MRLNFALVPTSTIIQPRLTRSGTIFVAIAAWLAIASVSATARAQVGRRNFIEPLVEEDANPSNSFDLIPQWLGVKHGYVFATVFSLEKQLSKNSSIELANAWNDPTCDRHAVCEQIGGLRHGSGRHRHRRNTSQVLTGFGDLEVLLKYAFAKSDPHEFRLSAGLDNFLPLGNPTAGGGVHTALGPILMISKGMGDIPDWGFARYLRPFALQADLEYVFTTGGPAQSEPIANWVISYDLNYLDRYVGRFNLSEPFVHLVPFAEFTYDQIVKARYATGQADLRVLPGFAYVRESFQLTIATMLALNQATVHNAHAGVELMLSLVLDQLWPVLGETPLQALPTR
jgi:hypothetical protein